MSDSYSTFLEYFCNRDEETIRNDDGRLCDQIRPPIARDEIEGECLDLCLQYLGEKCPHRLAVQISREVTDKVVPKFHGSPSDSGEKPTDSSSASVATSDAIEWKTLAQEVVQMVKNVCKNWKSQLPSSILELTENNIPQTSDHAIKNTRRKMEDKHVIIPYLCQLTGLKKDNSLQFYGVYDGHGGTEAAKYASVHLHCNLARSLREGRGIPEAIKEAFIKTDDLFVNHAKRENISSGSTAVCAILEDKMLHIAWLGDSQAVLVRNGKPVTLMDPHKPEREDERKRIEDLGGYVVWFGAWRVNGNLSVSRAIGDANFKPYVCATADVSSFPRDPLDDYLVIACDGLWDALKPEDLIEEVQAHLQSGKDRSEVAKHLTETAKERGSSDNISVIVIFLRDRITFVSKKQGEADDEKEAKDQNPKEDGGAKDDATRDAKGETGSKDETARPEGGTDKDVAGPDKQGGVNECRDHSHLAVGTDFGSDMKTPKSGLRNLLENDSSEVNSSGDIYVLSGDSTKNVLNPMRIHSSDDTNEHNASSETEFEAVGYESSPASNLNLPKEKSLGSDDSLSPGSQSTNDMMPRFNVGIHGTPHRSRRRRHSGNRRSRKENRRPFHDKMKTATPPCIQSISADRKQLDISFRESCQSLSQTSSHLLKMLSGYGARSPPQRSNCSFRSTNKDRWTIAVEVEDWAAMFESNKPIGTTQAMNLSTHW